MKVNAKFRPFIHTDSQVLLSTAGVLGETFIDIDSTQARGAVASNQLRAAVHRKCRTFRTWCVPRSPPCRT